MADHPPFLRHKLNGGIYEWTELLAWRMRIDDDMEPYYPETENEKDDARQQAKGQETGSGASPQLDAKPEGSDAAAQDQDTEGDRPGTLSKLHWREVKKRVLAAGGTWTNRADGVLFLEGL